MTGLTSVKFAQAISDVLFTKGASSRQRRKRVEGCWIAELRKGWSPRRNPTRFSGEPEELSDQSQWNIWRSILCLLTREVVRCLSTKFPGQHTV